MNKIIKNTLILTVITVVSGLLLGIVYGSRKSRSLQHRRTRNRKRFAQFSPMHLNLLNMRSSVPTALHHFSQKRF